MPPLDAHGKPLAGSDLVKLRHPEWGDYALYWRWMLDSFEGGQRYRNAVYGYDYYGFPVRNLVRHKREYPDPREISIRQTAATYPAGIANGAANPGLVGSSSGVDAAQFATDSDYEMRRARTPVPTFVREAIEDKHLAKVYSKEVRRDGPDALERFWEDVDGKGTPIDDWMADVAGPLFLLLGQLDVLADHPRAPAGAAVESKADQERMGLDRVVLTYVLPENMLWWQLDPAGRYEECLVQEYSDQGAGPNDQGTQKKPDGSYQHPTTRYRLWTATGSTLYDGEGKVVETVPHPFGRVPIVRVFDRRRPRTRNIGMSRYEGIAERMREYYNRDSELILSDTLQAHPLLQGPEDFVKEDGSLPVGPGWLLPKKKNAQGGNASYEGFDVVDFPKGAAESIRMNKLDIREEVDRDAKLTKPAGAQQGKGTVAQSGVSKQLDHVDGHELCSKLAKSLARLEVTLAELVLLVASDGKLADAEVEAIDVVYPNSFNLMSAEELTKGLTDFQLLLASAGDAPLVETASLQKLTRLMMPGEPDERYKDFDKELELAVAAKAALKGQMAEGTLPDGRTPPPDTRPPGSADGGSEESNRLPFVSALPGVPIRGGY
jgi:hypothetical protein